jgi:hypothetical protein
MKSIARLESDPLPHVVINFGLQFVCNIVFRLGQKNGWAKICHPKKGFHVFALTCFCRNKIVVDYRDISNHDDARTTLKSSAVQSAAVLDLRFDNEKDHSRRAGKYRPPEAGGSRR